MTWREVIQNVTIPDAEEYKTLEENVKSLDPKSHTSLRIGVEELKRLYDKEDDRRKSVESKTGGVIAVNGILLGIAETSLVQNVEKTYSALILVLFAVSTAFALWNLRPIKYWRPISIKSYPDYTRNNERELRSILYSRTFSCASFNKEVNDVRYRWFNISILLTGIAVVIFAISALASVVC